MKKFEDYFDVYSVFHPTLFFKGDTPISRLDPQKEDLFLLNALETRETINTKKGKKTKTSNLYENFLIKYYYLPLADIFKSDQIALKLPPKLILTDDYNEEGRNLHFGHIFTLMTLLEHQNPQLLEMIIKNIRRVSESAEYNDLIIESLREEKLKIEDYQKNGDKSQYAEELYEKHKHIWTKENKEAMLKARITALDLIIKSINKLPEFYGKPVNLKEFVACFNYDKLCLCLAYALIEASQAILSTTGDKLDPSIYLVHEYISAVEEYKKDNPRYNPFIVDMEDKERIVLTYDNLKEELDKLMAINPEYKPISISEEQLQRVIRMLTGEDKFFDISAKENYEIIKEAVAFIGKSQGLAYSWEMFPKDDEKIDTDYEPLKGRVKSAEEIAKISNDKIRRSEFCRAYLHDTPMVCDPLDGIGTFTGCKAYIYENGKVIIEKFIDDGNKSDYVAATYVMHIKDWPDFSNLPKLELIDKIRREKEEGQLLTSVKRIIHQEDLRKWADKIEFEINQGGPTREVIDYIDYYISIGLLVRKQFRSDQVHERKLQNTTN